MTKDFCLSLATTLSHTDLFQENIIIIIISVYSGVAHDMCCEPYVLLCHCPLDLFWVSALFVQ